MPGHFNRMSPPPQFKDFRESTRRDFRRICAYCLTHEHDMNGPELFDLDHHRPRSLFPELAHDYYNHYYCCKRCNGIKFNKWPSPEVQARGIGFVDLCSSQFETHYRIREEDQAWDALTPSAKYTIEQLRLDSPHLLRFRRRVKARPDPNH